MSFYLAIVSPLDSPLFELSFPSAKPPPPSSAAQASTSSSFPSWSTFTAANGADTSLDGSLPKVGGSLGLLNGENKSGPERDRAMCQMIAHKSLDSLEEVMEGTGSLYFKNVDRHNEWTVSAFIATSVKFILLHDIKNDDGIRLFFLDVWEAYVKVLLNPFHTVSTPIRNPAFEGKIRASAKRNL
ncbi:hypothetical protein I317_01302 [Kwoniella heveanensis CBS 569]|uniref:Trafficking protein particle complex subunit 2 n=1 Tax=Kwoniella heveanensis BCC8398 TaxID=1296120 RepID=A0A1B9GRW4_9TREE|nr:hypothetical protein I316_04522 [Kwoniella heveanensis BCC8398]OCF44813.1 hypothetical protein I317_01302 [Kwoniella heveanensis CBS 569]